MFKKRKEFLHCYGAFAINGALALSIGSLLPFISETYGIAYAFTGLLLSLHSVGNLCSSFLSGVLPLFIGRRKSVLLFSSFTTIAYLIILLTDWIILLPVAFLMTGFSRGATSNFGNGYINEIAPSQPAPMNILHSSFAVGALLFPIVTILLTSTGVGNWKWACVIMIILGILQFLIYTSIPIENDRIKAKGKKSTDLGFLKEKRFVLTCLTLFAYLCCEQGVLGWLITYFKDSGLLSSAYAQLMASILWIMILCGRLTTAYVSKKVDYRKMLRYMGIGFFVFFMITLLSRDVVMITIGVMGFGFSMAGIYPTTVSGAGDIIRKYPLAWSVMLTTASMGSIIMPSVMGMVASKFGILAGMSTLVVSITLTICFILMLTSNSNHKNNSDNAVITQ